MNQLLDTGDEQFRNNSINYGNYNKQPKQKVYKEKSAIEINKIVIFFSISILILGICIIAGSIFAKNKINRFVEESARPTIDFSLNEEDNSVDVIVKHQKGIAQVSYKLNNEDEIVVNGNNQKTINKNIKLSAGENKIVVKAIDENNNIVEYEHEYTIGNLAEITLKNVDNGVNLEVKSVKNIKNITYNWDGGEETSINVNSTSYVGDIATPKGKHTLKIVVLDEDGTPTEKTQVVIGATAPKIVVQAIRKDDGKIYYLINITDETTLKNVKITLNDEEKINTTVNSSEYTTELELQNNSANKLIVEASNENLSSNSKKSCPLNQ